MQPSADTRAGGVTRSSGSTAAILMLSAHFEGYLEDLMAEAVGKLDIHLERIVLTSVAGWSLRSCRPGSPRYARNGRSLVLRHSHAL